MKKSKQSKQDTVYRVGASLPNKRHGSQLPKEKIKEPISKKTKVKRIALVIASVFLILGFLFGAKVWNSIKDSINGSLFDLLVKNEPLKKDENGRTNIVLFGTSEDDEGHSGATLADSIMVVSLDQESHEVDMVSVPRDLWVEFNTKCMLGSEGKINASYFCALNKYDKDVEKASQSFGDQVGEVVGLDIHYFVKVNYSVVRDTVNALGGITVNIESRDNRGIYDVGTKVKLPNGKSKLDGETALLLTRARGLQYGSYGFAQANFDRERNQQAVLRAIFSKAISGGTLANVPKALSTVDSLGNNIVTNIKSSEIKSAVRVANKIKENDIQTLQLNNKENPLVITGNIGRNSIVRPKAGIFDYSEIHSAVAEALKPTQSASNN